MVKLYSKALLWIALILTQPKLLAQNSDGPKSLGTTYYLKNCFVVQRPGSLLSGQNVIIKDGFIAAIGADVKPPFDAQFVSVDSMYIYAGFIDAFSNVGVVKPESKDRPKLADPGNPPNDVAGITPQFSSKDAFKSSDKSVGEFRSAGITLANIAPRGLMLPGYSNVLLLGEDSADKLMVKPMSGQTFQLETNRGFYPSTAIGILAKFRDLYKNSAICGKHDENYKLNPAGLARPDFSAELAALYPVTSKKIPLFFIAQKTKDVHKALALKDELGFDLILTEVKQGWHYLDKIKNSNSQVLLALELPETEKNETKTEAKKDSTTLQANKSIEKKDADPALENFNKRKEVFLNEYLAQAAMFEKYGISFGFSFLNVKAIDIKKNIIKMMEHGLSEQGALAALTTHPAQILGISNVVGTVEKGKLANLVITDKPYFSEKSTIKYVFVDGKKFDYSEKPKKEAKPSEAAKFVGTWNYIVEIPGSKQQGQIVITKNNGEYGIKVADDSSPNDEDTATNISTNANNLSFEIIADLGQPVKVVFDLNFDEKKYTGTVSLQEFGTFPIKGEFVGDPK